MNRFCINIFFDRTFAKVWIISFWLTTSYTVDAQNKTIINSLKKAIINVPKDSVYLNKLSKICAYYAENNLDSTLKYGESLRKLSLQLGDKKSLGDLYNYYGMSYIPIRDDSAKLCLERSLRIREAIGSKKELIEIHTNLAYFYNSSTSRSDKALSEVTLAINLCEELQKKGEVVTNDLAYAYIMLAQCFINQNIESNALIYYQKALDLLNTQTRDENHKLLIFINDDLGGYMMNRKFYDDALCYFEQAYYHHKSLAVSMGKGNVLRKIGKIYYFQKDYAKALYYHQQAEDVLIKENDLSYTGYVWLNLAQDYKALNQIELALVEAHKAFDRGIKREIPGLIIPSAIFLAEAYTSKKDFEKALFYTNEASISKEKLAKLQNEQVKNDLIAKYEVREKDDKIAYLNQENELKNEVLKAQRIGISAGIGIGILFMILGIILVVNYRKKIKTNKLLSMQKQELQALNNVKDKLFSIISHDLRSPLNDLSMFLQLSPEKTEPTKTFAILSQKVMTVQHLLDNLLQWSVIQMKQINPTKVHVEVYDLVEEVYDWYKDISDKQGVRIEYQVSKNAVAFCDENMLRFVLRNLLTNALKFTPKGKKIVISAEENEKNIRIMVEDEGVGMNEATLAALFSQTVSTQQGIRGEKGTGLGLTLCKEYVEKNGGNMTVFSKEALGTKVIITLPN